MLEIKVTVEIPGLPESINALAAAITTPNAVNQAAPNPQDNDALKIAATTAQRFIKACDVESYVNYLRDTNGLTDEQIHAVCCDYVKGNASFFNISAAPATVTPAPTAAPAAPTAAPAAPAAAAPAATPAPTTASTITIEKISLAGAALASAGRMGDLMAIVAKHGVQALTQLKPEQYEAVAADLRALGAQI